MVFYNKLQQSTSGQLVEAWPKEIARTPVQKKTPCPALVSFGDLAIEIPIDSMNGRVPKCIIEVRDKDFNPLGSASFFWTAIQHAGIPYWQFAFAIVEPVGIFWPVALR